MKKKKILLMFLVSLCISSFFNLLYAEDGLKEATPMQFIAILIENDALDTAEELLDSLTRKEKKTYEYFYLSAKLEEGREDNDKAIKFYQKAWEKDKENLVPRLNILSIYIRDKKYKKKIKKELKTISKLDMTEDERKEFETLKELFEEEKQKNYMLSLVIGATATDNVNSTKEDLESDTIANLNLAFAHQKITENKLVLISFVSYSNSTYSTFSENSSNTFVAGFEPGKNFKSWQVSAPLVVNYTLEDGEESSKGYSFGLGLNKIFKNQANIGLGTDIIYTDNVASEYKGNLLAYYLEFGFKAKSGRGYSLIVDAESTDYDLESENYSGLGGTISTDKLYAEKYLTSLSYSVLQKDYDIDREDLNHIIDADLKANVFKTKWKYILAYSYIMNDSNSEDYEYTTNEISLKLKRDF